MNENTVKFHLDNIAKNNRAKAHIKDLEDEISSLRSSALLLKSTSAGNALSLQANLLQKKLDEAIRKRFTGVL